MPDRQPRRGKGISINPDTPPRVDCMHLNPGNRCAWCVSGVGKFLHTCRGQIPSAAYEADDERGRRVVWCNATRQDGCDKWKPSDLQLGDKQAYPQRGQGSQGE